MNRLAWILPLFAMPFAVQPAGIYKCTGGAYVAYQNFPCPNGLDERMMVQAAPIPDIPVPEARVALPSQASDASQQPQRIASAQSVSPTRLLPLSRPGLNYPFARTTLQVGMSDDEVLNLPRWGLPDHITRAKVNGVWNEDWLYTRTVEPKRLHFQNAVLTAVDADSSAQSPQYASVSTNVSLR